MEIFKVELKTTNAMKNDSYSKTKKFHIDVENGFIYVSRRDLEYIMDNFEFVSIEAVGLLFERPCEIKGVEE